MIAFAIDGALGAVLIAAAMLVLLSWYWDQMRVERWRESHPSGRLPEAERGKMIIEPQVPGDPFSLPPL